MVWMLGTSLAAHAQSAPQTQEITQEILNRLDRLEQDNQALLEEVRALRQEVSVLKPANPAAAPVNAVEAEERQEVQQNRIEELAQTKVEASQKFPIRITGMALFNASVNGRYNGNAENPLVASFTPADETGGGTLRQSTLGLLYNGPETFLGGKISGSLYMDFFGGTTASLNHLLRLRTAAITLDWKNTSISVGQDKPIISPRDPDSFAQVGVFAAHRRRKFVAVAAAGRAWNSDSPWATIPGFARRPASSDHQLRWIIRMTIAGHLSTATARRSKSIRAQGPKAGSSCGGAGARPSGSKSPAGFTVNENRCRSRLVFPSEVYSAGLVPASRLENWSFPECSSMAGTSPCWARCRKASW